jgi:hypothetical protein
MPEPLQLILFVGFAGIMLILRLDARRFGAAEWDTEEGSWQAWLPRLTWYAAGLALALMVFALHPSPVADLNLVLAPDSGDALLLGLVYAAAGVGAAFAMALLSTGRISFPSPGRYPGGAVYAVGTAFYDEFLFRGVILGVLLTLGLPDWLAVGGAALIYTSAVGASAAGRGGIMPIVEALAIGLAGGVLVLMTAGLGAALLGHTATRFALFLSLGPVAVPEPAPLRYAGDRARATGDSRAWLIPPRGRPSGRDRDDGHGGMGPFRRA